MLILFNDKFMLLLYCYCIFIIMVFSVIMIMFIYVDVWKYYFCLFREFVFVRDKVLFDLVLIYVNFLF